MIRHVVMWKSKEQADGQDRATSLMRAKRELELLSERISGTILNLVVGLNKVDDESKFDLVLIADFDDHEALARYLSHPEHKRVVELVMNLRYARAAVDFEI